MGSRWDQAGGCLAASLVSNQKSIRRIASSETIEREDGVLCQIRARRGSWGLWKREKAVTWTETMPRSQVRADIKIWKSNRVN